MNNDIEIKMSYWPQISNAKITRTTLGIEDNGVMSFFVFFDWYGGSGGLGGYALDGYGHGYQAIRKIIETVGVTQWEKLPGTLIRIENNGPGAKLIKIGHIIENKWFDIEEYMRED